MSEALARIYVDVMSKANFARKEKQ